MLGIYAFTIPLVEMFFHAIRWPTGTLRIYERYCVPFYAWAGEVEWFFRAYYIWWSHCDMVPHFAILTLTIVATVTTVCGIYYDRHWAVRIASRRTQRPRSQIAEHI